MSAIPVLEGAGERVELSGRGGIRLVADTWGDPTDPGVLFLHGGGQTRQAWRRSAGAIAEEGFFAMALDSRGHGESDWHPEGDYRLASFLADVEEVLDGFSRPPAIVGASLGGLTALMGAGEREAFGACAIVLVDVAPRLESEGTTRIVSFMKSRPEGYATLEEAADAVAAYTPHRTRETNLDGLRANLRQGEDGRWRWHWDPRFMSPTGPAELVDKERLRRAARAIDLPTLLVRGQMSDVLSEEGARDFQDLVPHSEYVDVTGAGHMVVGDRNDVFTGAIVGFLEKHR